MKKRELEIAKGINAVAGFVFGIVTAMIAARVAQSATVGWLVFFAIGAIDGVVSNAAYIIGEIMLSKNGEQE